MVVYLITNKINGKYYVGKTIRSLHARWIDHVNDALRGKTTEHFYRSIRKYGPESFIQEVITSCESNKILTQLERFWILSLRSYDTKFGYNMTFGGDGGNLSGPSPLKGRVSPLKGKTYIQIYGQNASIVSNKHARSLTGKPGWMTGKDFSAQHRKRISQSKIGLSRGFWITNGVSNTLLKEGSIPDGWRKGKVQKQSLHKAT